MIFFVYLFKETHPIFFVEVVVVIGLNVEINLRVSTANSNDSSVYLFHNFDFSRNEFIF